MAHIFQELLCYIEGNIWEIVVMIIDPTEVRDPLKEEGIQVRMGDCLIEGDILIGIEDLLEEEDFLVEDPLMVEDPLIVEDSLMEMEDPLEPPVDKYHQVLKDFQPSETCYGADAPYNSGYLCFGRYFQYSWTVYAAIGQSARLIDIYNSTSNRASSICKHIWAPYSN